MSKNVLRHLTQAQRKTLFDAFNYMKMGEIKVFCNNYGIATSGKKGQLLDRLKHYLLTGEMLQPKVIPAISKAKPEKDYPLKSSTLILQGAYKNDLRTRIFFKKLIGEHFHFTAFGQDWIMNQWQQGKPPTYIEFATAWQKEYLKRKKAKANPKKEWAYLNFLQRYQKKHPKSSKKELALAWEAERQKYAKKAINVLSKIKIA